MELPVRGRGRPRKFNRPARAVTVTLPEDVIARLQTATGDLGRSIVTLVERQPRAQGAARESASVSRYGSHGVIVVPPFKVLQRLPGVELVPIGDGRALISLTPGLSVPQFELTLRDALDRARRGTAEWQALHTVAGLLRESRLSGALTVKPRTIMVLETKRPRGRRRE
jgi:hypothetical protein